MTLRLDIDTDSA